MKNKTTQTQFDIKKLDSKSVKAVYYIFQALIVLTLIASILLIVFRQGAIEKQLNHILLCVTALILFNVPNFLKKKMHLYIPSALQIVALVMLYAHFILGEIFRVFDHSLIFDKVLHTTSGLALSALGFSVINLLNDKNTHLRLSPFFVALFSFCFSMCIAAMWEIFEYLMDEIFLSNMQRWQMTAEQIAASTQPGRFGLVDTMGDMIVATIGSLVICSIGYFSLRHKNRFINSVLLRQINNIDDALQEIKETNDTKLADTLQKALENYTQQSTGESETSASEQKT